jgi:diphosphomevalonate decarboxylase
LQNKIARAFAPTNIALAKYWGKRDVSLNLPENSSLSACLKGFGTITSVEFNSSFTEDTLILNGETIERSNVSVLKKVTKVLENLRRLKGTVEFARVQTENNFPTGAGLASSASGLCALTLAASKALDLKLSLSKLSEIARQGSGSACRSFFDGYALWERGKNADGSDSVAQLVVSHTHWPLKVAIVIVEACEKKNPSTDAMKMTAETSPYFPAWVSSAEREVEKIKTAVLKRNFSDLAELSELNCIRMHASAMAAHPPIIYWKSKTLEIMNIVTTLRQERDLSVLFTIDAGPNVVIFYEPEAHEILMSSLLPMGLEILQTEVGPGAKIL